MKRLSLVVLLYCSIANAMPAKLGDFEGASFRRSPSPFGGDSLFKRQTTPDGTCGWLNSGKNGYSCTTGYPCCSQWGWCGNSDAHCGAGCQPGFGTCNGGGTPQPQTTSPQQPSPTSQPQPGGAGRPRLGSVPYGVRIDGCTVPGTVALTFDDGPFIYTPELLDTLSQHGARATFFINGQNWGGPITDESNGLAAMIRRMNSEGHQIGSHTWSHPDLSTLSAADIQNQMSLLENALFGIIGKFPTYMRPPYFSCDDTCFSVLDQMGYHVIFTNLDTFDYANDSPTLIVNSETTFNNAVSANPGQGAWLVIAHDVHVSTVRILTEYMLERINALGYRTVTVGECLEDPAANWYRTSLDL